MDEFYERVANLSSPKRMLLARKLNQRLGSRQRGVTPQRLVAYAVLRQGHTILPDELRGLLKERLPDHMVPSRVFMLDALPLTENGKLNRKALAERDDLQPPRDSAQIAPRNETEQIIAGIWQEIMLVERVNIDDNFFDLGGHSLLATQVVSRLRKAFQLEIPLQKIFELPTVADLALHILESQAEQVDSEKVAQMLAELEQAEDTDQ